MTHVQAALATQWMQIVKCEVLSELFYNQGSTCDTMYKVSHVAPHEMKASTGLIVKEDHNVYIVLFILKCIIVFVII